jgi:hypothetical protein
MITSSPTRCLRARTLVVVAMVAITTAAGDCGAIEMFTYFGDGSRIGLPSLEVPIEAYPGIPLRSDRIRARRRAMRPAPNASMQAPRGTPIGNGMSIRAMPTAPAPAPIPEPIAAPLPKTRQSTAKPTAR